ERFLKQVEADSVMRAGSGGETASVHRHAFTHANAFANARGADLQACATAAGNAADFFDETGEHRCVFLTLRNEPANQQKHRQENGQGKLQNKSDETGGVHFVLLGDRFNHEVGTVADVGERAEQDCAHGNGGQFGVAAGSELLHRVGVFNAEAAATESIS